jgi:uncharacterized protein
MGVVAKPDWVFDRETEWRELVDFVSVRQSGRPRLGVVTGRRRQGKTYLLQALAAACGGFYFGATQATETESLALFGDAWAAYSGAAAPPRLESWDAAIRLLFAAQRDGAGPGLVIIDEFPYLSAASPALPSILQRELDHGAVAGGDTTLLLCGSALSVMGGLLSGSAPLRGRAGLEIVMRPFPFWLAARYWEITDPDLAILHNAVVGGTPAYRLLADPPTGAADFDDWVARTVLNRSSPLFREARYLLAEEPGIRDTALYHSVLAAVAAGNGTRGGIATYVGRQATDVSHHLNVLEDCGLLRRDPDVFRSGRSRYRICEPLITFYHAIMRPHWSQLESGRARAVWQDARSRFRAQVAGPHFEQLCRDYALAAPAGIYGQLAGTVGSGVITDPALRETIEIDVAVLGVQVPGERQRVLSLGEAKLGRIMGSRDVQRLRRAADLLADRGYDTSETVPVCYGGSGFESGLEGAILVGPAQLYAGSGTDIGSAAGEDR